MGLSVFPTPSAVSSSVPNWTLINRATANANSFTWSGLSGYKSYKIVWTGFSTNTNGIALWLRLNGDTGSVYTTGSLIQYDIGSARNPSSVAAADVVYYVNGPNTSLSTDAGGGGSILLERANSTDGLKSIVSEGVFRYNNFSGAAGWCNTVGGWANTSAITSIQLFLSGGATLQLTQQNNALEIWGAN